MQDRRELLLAALAASMANQASAQEMTGPKMLHRQPLPDKFAGMDAAFVEVVIPPGPGSPSHKHSGMVLGYVIEGELLFGINDEKPKRLKAGSTFYEPPGSRHTSAASALPGKPVKILAIVIGPAGAQVSTFEH